MWQPVEPPGGAEAAGKAQRAGNRPGVEDWIPQVAHARALRGRAARPLRAGEEEIRAFHLADPALRGPGGAPRPVPATRPAGGGATAPGGRAAHFRDRAELR